MHSHATELKTACRLRVRAQLQTVSLSARADFSSQLSAQLARQPAWRNARTVLLFAPLPDEPDIVPLLALALATGKAAALPRYAADSGAYVAGEIRDLTRDLAPGRFGILEPRPHCPELPLNRLDLILVPGVAFDACGRRLGRGKGFYDRLLAQVTGKRCGVAFDFQIVPEVPTESHDVRLDYVVTPTRWLAMADRNAT